ncbi:MAG: hypothetical protein IZT55_01330 [Anaerolineae bacterium]|nr:hypothetical protein [Anaerolineae bacterium]
MAKQKSRRKKRKSTKQEQHRMIQPGMQEGVETPQLIALQQRVGNQAVNEMLGEKIQRQIPKTDEDQVDFSSMGRGNRLPGHGNLGGNKMQNAQVPDIQKRGPFGVGAAISLTVNPPTYERKPAAEIAAAHGRPGVAGWTTPRYQCSDPTGGATDINIDFTLDFEIELAEEYTGTPGQVLQDHEQGHVNIGRRKAQQHFVDGLRANLESQHVLNRPVVGAALSAAQTNFVNDEGADSQAFDQTDYPRMTQAYHGALTPLADLSSKSGNIADMVARLRNFNNAALSGTQGQVEIFAMDVIRSRAGLTNDELNQLQYNPEFKTLVTTTLTRIDAIIEQYHYDLWVLEFSTLGAATEQILAEMRTTLDEFTWVAPG